MEQALIQNDLHVQVQKLNFFVDSVELSLEEVANDLEQQLGLHFLELQKNGSLIEALVYFFLRCDFLVDHRPDHVFDEFVEEEKVIALSDEERGRKRIDFPLINFVEPRLVLLHDVGEHFENFDRQLFDPLGDDDLKRFSQDLNEVGGRRG